MQVLRLTFVPLGHVVFLLRLILSFPRILVQILLLPFPLHGQIMAEFAFLSLLAVPLLVKCTQYRLRIHPKWHLLYLNRLEQLCCFSFCLFRGRFILFSLRFFGLFSFLIGGFGLGGLAFDLLDLFLGLCSFFLWLLLHQNHRSWQEQYNGYCIEKERRALMARLTFFMPKV